MSGTRLLSVYKRRGLARELLTGLCVLFTFMFVAVSQAQATEKKYEFHIPAGKADSALNLLARQSNTPLLFPQDEVRNIRTNSVVGRYTVQQALDILLADTGIIGQVNTTGGVTIRRPDPGKPPSEESKAMKNEKMSFLSRLAVALFAAASMGSHIVPLSAAENSELIIEEIVVEARRRTESLQEVPVSITALNAEFLADNSIQDLRSIQDFTPGLNIEEGFDTGSARFFIRGLGTAVDNNGVEPGVGVYVDDVYVPTGVASNLDLFSLDRVEVLRGPQGTLYGRNTFGGAIKLYSKGFSNEAEGYVSLGAGTENRRDIKTEFSAPVIDDRLWINAGYAHTEHDGFQRLVNLGADGWAKNTDVYKIRVQVAPTDRLRLNATFDRADSDAAAKHPKILAGTDLAVLNTLTASWFGPEIGNGLVAAIQDPPAISTSDIDHIESDILSDTEQLIESFSWSAVVDLTDNLVAKYIGSTRDVESIRPYDVDGKVSPFLTIILDDEIDSESHELRLQWESERLKAVGGFFYYKEDQLNNTRNVPNIFGPFINVPGLLPVLDTDGDGLVSPVEAASVVVDDVLGNPTGVAFTQSSLPLRFSNDLESYAGYVNLSYAVNETLNFSAGLRYTEDKRTATVGDEVTFIGGFTGDLSGDVISFLRDGVQATQGGTILNNPSFTRETFTVDRNFSKLTPSVVLDYKVNDDLLTYFSWQRGFQGGQLYPLYSNLQAIATQAAADGVVDAQEEALVAAQDGSTDEQTVDAFEIGVKSKWLDGRVLLNGSVYYYEFDDLIASIAVLIPGAGVPTVGRAVPTNAGKAESKGLELEAQLLLTENIRIYGNLAYTDFDLKEVLAPDPSDITTNINIKDDFITTAVLTPEFQGSIGMDYTTEVAADSELRAYVNLAYRDKMGINARALGETFGVGLAPSSSPDNDAWFISPSLTKIDLGGSWTFANWSLHFAVKNVTDTRRPIATRFASVGYLGVSQSFNAPRTWELGLRYNFF